MTNSEPQLLPFIQTSNLRSHSARLSALPSISVTPSTVLCLSDSNDHHTARPGTIHGPLPPLACVWGGEHDPVLPVVPGTGAPSPHPHCSPPLAALHLHLLAPSSMPSPRSQPPHTAHYPTATHHPSKSGSIHVSRVTQCDVMLYLPTPPTPPRLQSSPDACMMARCMRSFFLPLPSPLVRAEDPSVVFY